MHFVPKRHPLNNFNCLIFFFKDGLVLDRIHALHTVVGTVLYSKPGSTVDQVDSTLSLMSAIIHRNMYNILYVVYSIYVLCNTDLKVI